MPNVLFVCTANQCRSPMAEVIFRHKLESAGLAETWSVESAGTWAVGAVPATHNAQQQAAEHGLDLSAHRSRPVDDLDLAAFDLILVMTADHQEALAAEFPDLSDRVQRLTAMAGAAYDVADPVGQDLAAYGRTWHELEGLIDAGFEAIQRHASRRP